MNNIIRRLAMLSPKTIWNYKQNKPTLIVHDFESHGVPAEVTYRILLTRGVFKWLSVRRDLIKLKNTWKFRITSTISKIHDAKKQKDYGRLMWLRGYLKAYEECRGEIRALCHSERWQAPDFDVEAQKYLNSLSHDSSA